MLFRKRGFSDGSEVSRGALAPYWRFRVGVSTRGLGPKPQRPYARRRGQPREHSTPLSCQLDHDSSGIGEVHAWAHQHGIDTCGSHTGDRFRRGFPRVPVEPVQIFLGASPRVGVGSYSFQPLRHLFWALRPLRAMATKSCAMMHHPTYLWKPASPLYQARFIPN